jgi:phytoene synthase
MTAVGTATAPPGLTLAEARAQALAAVNRSGSSFTLAMKLMARPKRQAMFAVYAFARAVDDIADGDEPPDIKKRQLQEWRQEVDAVYARAPRTAIGMALAEAVHAFALPKQEFLLLIEGMAMDAAPIVAPSLVELLAYTRRAAGTVGMLSMPIFGAPPGPASDRFALALADGLQLTNILRDVREDAEIGRLYLPREVLAEHGLAGMSPAEVAASPAAIAVSRALGTIARERFGEARAAMRSLDHRTIRPALMMMGVYEGYLGLLARADWGLGGKPVRLTKWQKLGRSLRYAIRVPDQP